MISFQRIKRKRWSVNSVSKKKSQSSDLSGSKKNRKKFRLNKMRQMQSGPSFRDSRIVDAAIWRTRRPS